MAFLQSQPPREPFLHAPKSVLWLIAVLIAIHLAVSFIPVPDDVLMPYVFIPARYTAAYVHSVPPVELVLPLVSHMFLHAGFLHLIVNCAWLLAFGPVVARRLGGWLFLVFFLAAGVAGALMELALTWGATAGMIGASGGISGLMAASFRMMRWPGVPAGVRLAPLFSRPILVFSGLWMATNLIFGLIGLGAGADQIAWQAHMGGYLFGLVAISLFDRLRTG
jgi:membrane associated rhomboid family serine protease